MVGAALGLEGEHGVDQVLERLRAGDAPLLGDVPDEEQRAAAALGVLDEPLGAGAHLPHRPGQARQLLAVQRLDGVDEERFGLRLLGGGEDRLDDGLAGDQQAGVAAAQPLGPQPQLARRLLGAGVEHPPAGPRQRVGDLQQQRRLADPRLAGEQHRAPGHHAAAEHAVEQRHAAGEAQRRLLVDDAERQRGRHVPRHSPRRRDRAPPAAAPGPPPRRSCPTPRTRAAAEPARAGVAALLADEAGARARHDQLQTDLPADPCSARRIGSVPSRRIRVRRRDLSVGERQRAHDQNLGIEPSRYLRSSSRQRTPAPTKSESRSAPAGRRSRRAGRSARAAATPRSAAGAGFRAAPEVEGLEAQVHALVGR